MKLKSNYITPFATVVFTMLLPFGALAQEDKFNLDAEIAIKEPVRQDQESPSGIDSPENRSGRNSITPSSQEPAAVRDSELKTVKAVVKTTEKPQKDEEKVQKKEEDPLSFNFLYYIIEKFKFSDIIE